MKFMATLTLQLTVLIASTLISTNFVYAKAAVEQKAPSSQVQKIDQKKLDALVNDYAISKHLKQKSAFENLQLRNHPDCHPGEGQGNCIDAVCEKLGSYNCDSQSEINEVARACRGVDGSCIQATCSRLGTYNCDSISEIREVAASCQNVYDSRCVDVVCEYLGSYNCDSISEIKEVGAMCRGRVDSDCIQNVCKRLGTYNCDSISEIRQVAQTCGGTN